MNRQKLTVSDLAAVRLLWLFTLGFSSWLAQRDKPRESYQQRMYGDAPDGVRVDLADVYARARALEPVAGKDVVEAWARFAREQARGAKPWGGPECDAASCAFVFTSGIICAQTQGDELAASTPPRPVGAQRLHELWDKMPTWARGRFVRTAQRLQHAVLDLVVWPDAHDELVEESSPTPAAIAS